jgi:RNA polymerase sigma-70 factor, ECF subfamily
VDVSAATDIQGKADLVRRIMAADQRAEAELVERYSRGITLIIRRELGGASVADDIYQETFRIALEKIRRGDLREPEKLSGFMCGIARNLVIEYFRRATRQESLTEIAGVARLPHHAPNQLEELLEREKAVIAR